MRASRALRVMIAVLGPVAVVSTACVEGQIPSAANNAAGLPRTRGTLFARQITLFDREGNAQRRLDEPGGYSLPAFSPDGTRLAVLKQEAGPPPSRHIWVFDLSTGVKTQLTFDPASESRPVWSPDGRAVAYTSRGAIYRKPLQDSGAEELLYQNTFAAGMALTDWSRDGSMLSFYSGGVLYALPLPGPRPPIELIREAYEAYNGRWSPDGHFLAYASDESGHNEIYVRAFDAPAVRFSAGGGKWTVSSQAREGVNAAEGESCYGSSRNCVSAYWRQDGRELLYVTPRGALMAVDVGIAPTFEPVRPRFLFQVQTSANAATWAVSPDGQQVVVLVPLLTERRVVEVPTQVLSKYVGMYVEPGLERFIVTLEGNRLVVQGESGQKQQLLAESVTYFFARNDEGDLDFEFFTDARGVVTHFIHYAGRGTTYRRQ